MPSNTHSEWFAARTVHLAGGCRIFTGFNPTNEFFPGTLDGQAIIFNSKAYSSLYAELYALEIVPLGFEFRTTSFDVKVPAPSNWRTFHPWGPNNIWPCNDQMEMWGQVGFAATRVDNIDLWDLSRRISHQLRVCAWRFYQVSDAYHLQLRGMLSDKDFQLGYRFEDELTWLGYLAVQAFLVDACILRDYLAEFVACYVFTPPQVVPNRITSMAGLVKHKLKNMKSSHAIYAELEVGTSQGGWLFTLGAYRDLVVHCVPLARAESSLCGVATEFPIKGAKSLVGVSLPLPSDPSAISLARASPKRTEQLKRELRFLSSAAHGDTPSTDALVYCYSALDALTRLAAKLQRYSPVKPELPHLTDKGITDEILVVRAAPDASRSEFI